MNYGRLLILLLLATACARGGQEHAHPAAAAAARSDTVLILQAQQIATYDAAISSFINNMPKRTTRMVMGPNTDAAELQARLEEIRPELILAVGSRAVLLARAAAPEVPTLFVLALNYNRLDLGDRKTVMGIAMEGAPISEFTKFKIVLPDLKRVLAPYTPGISDGPIAAARQELHELGIELIGLPVPQGESASAAVKEHCAGADVIWLSNDPVMRDFENLKTACKDKRLPVVTSLSEAFARSGALMSVSVSVEAVGAQAAGMARVVLERGKAPADLGVQVPNGMKLVLNVETARALGVDVPADILPFVDEIVDNTATAGLVP